MPHCDVEFCLYLNCSFDEMEKRLLSRGTTSGRNDDNLAVIKKRFNTYKDQTTPIIELFEKEGKLKEVNSQQVNTFTFC